MMLIKNHILFFFLICLGVNTVFAGEVRFTAEAKNNVAVGERFNITYTVNASGSQFRGPQIRDFNVLSGPNQSTSTSMQIIQGQMTQSVTLTFSYIVQAVKEGTFRIPPATINVGGKEYTSNALEITVVQGAAPSQPQQQQQQQDQTARAQASGQEIFLRAFVDNNNPVQGEQVIVTYKIYTSVPVSQYVIDRLASYAGFWSETLTQEGERPRQTTEVIDGVSYTVAEIRRIALFPQRSGQLTIAPLEVECVVQRRAPRQRRQSIFDDFFNHPFYDRVQSERITLKSNALTIEARPLPSQNRTAEFKGSVGNFNMDVNIDRTELDINDAVNLTVSVSGRGNLRMIEEPVINFPPNLETYDAKITDNINRSPSGISGKRTFEYLLIPRATGLFEISPVIFSFYNPSKGTYEILKSEKLSFNVAKGDGTIPSGPSVSMVSRENVQYIGSDIRFIKTNIFPLKVKGKLFFGSYLFWVLLLLPFILLMAFLLIWRRHLKITANKALVRNRKATRIAKKRLKKASLLMKNKAYDHFYDEVSKALWGFFNYKFNIPYADLSKEAIQKTFMDKNINTDIADAFINTLDQCEYARFAPGDKQHAMEEVYNSALAVITKIEKALKS